MKTLVPFFIAAAFLFAAEHGKITGRVIDVETGDPLIAADVVIEGMDLGASTDEHGYYEILYVPAGTYEILASYVSYHPYTYKNVVVNADQITKLDFKLPLKIIEVQGVTATAVRPLIVPSETGTGWAVTAREMDRLPVTTINQVISLQSGVVQSDLGTHMRGGRTNEITYFVDGVVTKVPNFGNQSVFINPSAVEEVSIVSGGFDAEYGDALSGIVNIVTKEGGSQHAGSARCLTDAIIPAKGLDYDNSLYDVSLGGPVPLIHRLHYFLSGELMMTDAFEVARYQVYSPRMDYTAQARIVYKLANAKGKFSAFGHNSRRQYIHWNPYNAAANNLKYFDNKPMSRIKNTIGSAVFNYMFTAKTLASIKVGVTQYENCYGNRDYAWEEEHDRQWYEDYRFKAEHLIDDLRSAEDPRDIPAILIDSLMQYHTEYTNRDVDALRNNPYGIEGIFYTYGDFRNWTYIYNHDYQARFDLTHTHKLHEFKTGVEFIQYDLQYYNNNLPWVTNPFWDYYDRTPYKLAVYLQDKMDFEGLIARIGMRVDYFDPRTMTYEDPGDFLDREIVSAGSGFKISPRLGFSLPVTDRIKLRFNYGHYFQLPGLHNMYSSTDTLVVRRLISRGNSILGNILLKPERTIQYELGIENQLSEHIAAGFTAYFKDIFDLAQIREVPALPTPYYQYFNVDYGNVKGFEFTMKKEMADMWALGISYNLQFARGTASFAGEWYNDHYLYNIDPPVIDYWLDFDERHIVNSNFDLAFPDNFRFIPLQNFSSSIVLSYHSGMPYTPQDLRGNKIGDENSARMPGFWNVDLNFSRSFPVGPLAFSINGIITNVFNTEQVAEVYPTTGLADDHGDPEPSMGQFGNIPLSSTRYSPQADFNHDGLINPVEMKHAYIAAQKDFYNDPTNYLNPLRVQLGVGLSF
jgi:outer membrane receptor protein involved in Fe transport